MHVVCCSVLLRLVGSCWMKFDQFQNSSNNFQQVATTHNMVCKRSQHVEPNIVASCWPTMLRAFARAFILTRLFPEFNQMFLHTLLETRGFDLLSTLETLLDLRYRPRSVTILPGKMLVTPLIRSNYLIKYIMLPVQMRDHSERRPGINLFGKECPVEICPPACTQFTVKQDKLDCIG